MQPLRALVPFVRRTRRQRQAHAECELCGAAVGERHAHVVEMAHHALRCACTACAVLFRDAGAGGGRFRTVSERVVRMRVADDADWSRLEVPVQLAFLIWRDGWTAVYPSPAGPVEAPLSESATQALPALVPNLPTIDAEVEALLLHRLRGGPMRCWRVPVDAGYALVGTVRQKWRGFDGGDAARAAIDDFVARLDAVAEEEP